MKNRIEDVRFYFENDSTPCGTSFGMGNRPSSSEDDFILYPNPAKEYLVIKNLVASIHSRVKIYDVLGRCVLEKTCTTNKTLLPLGHLNPGLYSVIIFTGGNIYSHKIIKQ